MVCYDRTIFGWDTTIWKSGIWGCKKIKILRKSPFKVVQMKFLAMHITNQKLSFDIFTVGNLQNIFMEHDLYLMSSIILTHTMYCWLLLQIYLCYLWLLLCSRVTYVCVLCIFIMCIYKCIHIQHIFWKYLHVLHVYIYIHIISIIYKYI